jgi:hypothetical protein
VWALLELLTAWEVVFSGAVATIYVWRLDAMAAGVNEDVLIAHAG